MAESKQPEQSRQERFLTEAESYGLGVMLRMVQVYNVGMVVPGMPIRIIGQMIWQHCATRECEPEMPSDFVKPFDPKAKPCGGSPYFSALSTMLRRCNGRTSDMLSSPFSAMLQLDVKARSFAELEYFDNNTPVLEEKKRRVANRDSFAALCLANPKANVVINPDYGPPGAYRVRVKQHPSDPDRKEYVFYADKPTMVPSVYAFTILNSHRGLVGEWDFKAPPGHDAVRKAKETEIAPR